MTVQLRPGQTTTVRFALSWDFPQVYYDGAPDGAGPSGCAGTPSSSVPRSTATNDYVPDSYPFKQAFTIAKRELARHDDSLAASRHGGSRSPRTRSTRCGCGRRP